MGRTKKSKSQSILLKYKRNSRGSQIAELPPSLIILLFVFLFPFMNMLYLVCAFGAGWYLNSIQLREVACNIPADLGLHVPPTGQYQPSVFLPQCSQWHGLFGVSQDPGSPEVAQFASTTPGSDPNAVAVSKVRTTINIAPFVKMQSLGTLLPIGNIPGLGKPITFVYNGEIQQEEPGP